MSTRLQNLLYAVSLVLSALAAFTTVQTRAAVAELKIEMLREFQAVGLHNEEKFVTRPEFHDLERRIGRLEK